MNNIFRLLVSITFLTILFGCAGTVKRNPLPVELILEASIPGVPEARFWADEWPTFSMQRFNSLTEADINQHFSGVYNVPHNYLAISGGGANGAFGAGLLAGWSVQGTRPEFNMVTGVSTGALSAPFAFLGVDYDDELKKVYTTNTPDNRSSCIKVDSTNI